MYAVVFFLAALAAVLPFGGLYLTSLPNGADVWVDGSYIGRTPLLIDGLRDGRHAVTVTKAGWKVEQLSEDVATGVTTPATVMLEPLAPIPSNGAIALHGLHAGAQVFIDGHTAQPPEPLYHVPAGTHSIVVIERALRFERRVTVYPNQTTHLLFHAPRRTHSAVVARADDYLPSSSIVVNHGRLVIRSGGHLVVGHIGDSRFLVDGREVVYDAPAGFVRNRLYLPLRLILLVTGSKAK